MTLLTTLFHPLAKLAMHFKILIDCLNNIASQTVVYDFLRGISPVFVRLPRIIHLYITLILVGSTPFCSLSPTYNNDAHFGLVLLTYEIPKFVIVVISCNTRSHYGHNRECMIVSDARVCCLLGKSSMGMSRVLEIIWMIVFCRWIVSKWMNWNLCMGISVFEVFMWIIVDYV